MIDETIEPVAPAPAPVSTSVADNSITLKLKPMQAFIGGIVGGVLLLCTIGFFILLAIVLKDKDGVKGDVAAVAKNNPSVNQGADNQPSGPAQITLRDVDVNKDHVRGNKDAKITIVTYTDFECPFCKRFHTTMAEVMKNYGKDIRWVIRQFPLDSLHSQARTEAIASECASEQGKFWEFADTIFANTPSNNGLDLAKLPDYAKTSGVKDLAKFNKCVADKKYADVVQADQTDGESAGAQGTPYSVVVGPAGEKVAVNGAQPYAQVEAAIKQFIK